MGLAFSVDAQGRADQPRRISLNDFRGREQGNYIYMRGMFLGLDLSVLEILLFSNVNGTHILDLVLPVTASYP